MATKMEAAELIIGLLGPEGDDDEGIGSSSQNVANRAKVIKNWALGPTKASVEPDANSEYWQQMADLWEIDEAQARRQLCANCEYFNNTPAMQENMESVPLDKFDRDGGCVEVMMPVEPLLQPCDMGRLVEPEVQPASAPDAAIGVPATAPIAETLPPPDTRVQPRPAIPSPTSRASASSS